MRCFRLPNSRFSFTEESILKFVSLKVRNLVSLPPGGTREAENSSHICGGGAYDYPQVFCRTGKELMKKQYPKALRRKK